MQPTVDRTLNPTAPPGYWTEGKIVNGTNVGGGVFVPGAAAPVPSLSSQNGAAAIDTAITDHKADVAAMTPAPGSGSGTGGGKVENPVYNSFKSAGGITASEASASGTDLSTYKYEPTLDLYMPDPTKTAGSTDQYSADQKTINDAFAQQVAGMDSATRALIDSIRGIYSGRIADQQEANKRELATFDTMNTRYGTSRYAPGVAQGVLTADERTGLDRVAKIAAEEAGLIAQANQSLQDKKYAAFVQQRAELNNLRKERVDTLQKLQDAAYKAAQDKIDNDLKAKIQNDTVSYNDKKLAIDQATLDETKRKNMADDLRKNAEIKIKQDAANLLSGAMASPVKATNGIVNAADQDAFLSKYSPEMQTLIKGVADYSLDPNAASKYKGSAMTPVQLQTLAKAYNPNYKAGQFAAVNSFLKSWASGGNNTVVQSANTVVQHLGELADQSTKLGNVSSGSLGPFTSSYNTTAQWLNEGAQNPSVKQFKQTALLVSSELAKIMKNGSGSNAAPTTEEIQEQLKIITANLSPQSAKAVIENSVQLMGDRLNTARENYMNVVGAPPPAILFPSAQESIKKLQQKGYAVDLSSLDPSPLANVTDDELINGITSGSAVSGGADPSQYFGSIMDIINAPMTETPQ